MNIQLRALFGLPIPHCRPPTWQIGVLKNVWMTSVCGFLSWILIHPHIAGWSFQIHLWIIYVWLWFDYVCFSISRDVRSGDVRLSGVAHFCQAPWWRSCRVSVTWRSCLTQQRRVVMDKRWYHVISTIWHEMDGITWDNNCLKKDCFFFTLFHLSGDRLVSRCC